MWKNIVERGKPQMTCPFHSGYLKLQYTHSGCVILIGFPLQQLLHERASLLHYAYIACPVNALFL